jgi:Tfp pilus assembly pilus retraction ATPase PilT
MIDALPAEEREQTKSLSQSLLAVITQILSNRTTGGRRAFGIMVMTKAIGS